MPRPPACGGMMIALAFSATVVNHLDRQVGRFHMTNVDYSSVVFAFMLAYTISNGFQGALIDRLGTKAGYALCIGGGP